jgi:V/A-type H+-transporting ATPase subunit A
MRGEIIRINGPLVIVKGLEAKMYDVVRVGKEGLIGEVIKIDKGMVFIQVYEDTVGIKVGEYVINTGSPLTVELGPGLLSGIFDGIQRPLQILENLSGFFIRRGISALPLSREKKWYFIPEVKKEILLNQGI